MAKTRARFKLTSYKGQVKLQSKRISDCWKNYDFLANESTDYFGLRFRLSIITLHII